MDEFDAMRLAKERLTDRLCADAGSAGTNKHGRQHRHPQAETAEAHRRRGPIAIGITRTDAGQLAHLVLGPLDDVEQGAIIEELGGGAPVLFEDVPPPRPLGAGGWTEGRSSGTLGCVVDRGGVEGVLTAAHVAVDLANGADVLLRSDGQVIARTQRHTPQRPGWLYADAVFAALEPGVHVDDRQGGELRIERVVDGFFPSGLLGERVVKFGAATGRREGRIDAVEVDLLGVPGFSDDPGFLVNLGRQLLISGDFATDGDSGALAFLADSERAVGLVSTAVGNRVALSAWWQIRAILEIELRSSNYA